MVSDSRHIREIEHVSQGRGVGRDPIVVASWLRCLNDYGLDPTARAAAHIVTDRELREHRQRTEDLVNIARSGIERLYSLVAGQNYVLLLANRAGVTVEYLGDEVQKAALRKGGLYLGAEWSEARAGTCAVGACLESGEALIIHQTDHFDATHGGLSCTAAPVYDTRGGLVATLDISLLASPQPRASQSMALNLVQQAVRRIEMANIMAESRREWVLRLAGSPDFLDVDPEAAISLDGSGRVIGVTHGAMRMMARAAGIDWRQGASLIGRPVSDFLNVSTNRLDDLTRDRLAAERLIETRDGHRLFAHAIEPRPAPAPRRQITRQQPPEALQRLSAGDPAMDEVLAQAAALAPSHLPLLITGETGTGKLTLARAIHDASGRRQLAVLAAEDLADPEAEALLLGRGTKPGLLAELDGGTLVLQNVEMLPLKLQPRLARLLAEGNFVPLGALRPIPINLRIIATSQRAPGTLASDGTLRPDFFHRLCGASFALPRLAERRDLIPLLERLLFKLGIRTEMPPELLRRLAEHPWPGNIRELDHLAARLAVEAKTGPVSVEALPATLTTRPTVPPSEAAVLAQMLEASGGNVSLCARKMGVDRTTIHRRMRRYGLTERRTH